MSLQGTVLGFSADNGTGAITGADGARYKFAAADWKGEGAPIPGAAVDFEISEDGHATGVYPLKPAAKPAASPAETQPAPDIGGYVASATRRPGLIGAIVALLICAFVGFINVTAPPDTDDLRLPDEVTILEMSELMGTAERALATRASAYAEEIDQQARVLETIEEAQTQNQEIIRDQIERYRQMRNAYGPNYGYERTPEAYGAELTADITTNYEAQRALPQLARSEAQARLNRLNEEKAFINLGFLIYLIPVAAALVLFMELTGRSSRLASVVLGASVVVGIGVIFFAKQRLEALFGDLGGKSQLSDLIADAANGRTISEAEATAATAQATAAAQHDFTPNVETALLGEALLSPALGTWLLLATAVGILAVMFGLVKIKAA